MQVPRGKHGSGCVGRENLMIRALVVRASTREGHALLLQNYQHVPTSCSPPFTSNRAVRMLLVLNFALTFGCPPPTYTRNGPGRTTRTPSDRTTARAAAPTVKLTVANPPSAGTARTRSKPRNSGEFVSPAAFSKYNCATSSEAVLPVLRTAKLTVMLSRDEIDVVESVRASHAHDVKLSPYPNGHCGTGCA